ncbi:hypothetical protein ERJ75_001572000 [Trypanosoma vivax]|nr:hypothetical protein ERJ75_001572000 [Trypanosoma vivax]
MLEHDATQLLRKHVVGLRKICCLLRGRVTKLTFRLRLLLTRLSAEKNDVDQLEESVEGALQPRSLVGDDAGVVGGVKEEVSKLDEVWSRTKKARNEAIDVLLSGERVVTSSVQGESEYQVEDC